MEYSRTGGACGSKAAWAEQQRVKADIRTEGKRLLNQMKHNGECGIVLAGRPYHIDPEINHGIPELIASYGLTVLLRIVFPSILSRPGPCVLWISGYIIPGCTMQRNLSANMINWR